LAAARLTVALGNRKGMIQSMKKTKKCPKCDSGNILVLPAKRGESRGVRTGITAFSLLRPQMHVCRKCGYVEEYFTKAQIGKL